jgi:hypothetical protein
MLTWYQFPGQVPTDTDLCWVRVKYYYGSPFLANWDSATTSFISLDNALSFPAFTVSRWALV